jgi:cell division septal protein FtsQ
VLYPPAAEKGWPEMSESALVDRDYAPPRDNLNSRSLNRLPSLENDYNIPPSGYRPAASSLTARTVKSILAGLLAGFALITLFFIAVLPMTEIHGLKVTGVSILDQAELASWAGLPEHPYWFNVDCEAIALNISAHPRVAGVSVERRFPNVVTATVVERVPLAVVYARSISGRIEAHCVDSMGVVFAPASDYPASGTLPVMSGLEIRGLRYGLRLEGTFAALLSSLAEIRGSNPALISAISEFRVVSRDGSPAELLVYPARYQVPVRMRPVLNAGLLKTMMLVLDVVEAEGLAPSIRELDLRNDTFVYRTKEAVSG